VSVRTYVHKVFFSDFDLIWCVGRPPPAIRTNMTSTRSKVKVKVKELVKLQKLHFSRSISSAIFAWSSKLMVGGDSMGPGLQRQIFEFPSRKAITRVQTSRNVNIYSQLLISTIANKMLIPLAIHGTGI